ncbi:MAG TPA: hypothetical protein DCX95_00675 [Elusimicrobia bacterium]|nr:hypothetical protein [Elusimicrobiota bacterium]
MRYVIICFSFLFIAVQKSYAFLDPLTGITNTLKSAQDKVYQEFMMLKTVEQIKIMYQNYNQSKKYYDEVTEMSKHKGGIAGYYRDDMKNRIDTMNKNTYWRFQSDMNADPDSTAYVRNIMDNTDKYIAAKTDFSKDIYELTKKRDARLKQLADDAAKKKMSQEELNEFNKRKDLLLIEYLASLDKIMQQLLKDTVEKESRDWNKNKEQLTKEDVDARQKRERQKQHDRWKRDQQRAMDEAEKNMPKEKAYRILGVVPGESIPTK